MDSLSDGATQQCFPTREAGNLVIKERAIDHAYHHTEPYIFLGLHFYPLNLMQKMDEFSICVILTFLVE